MWLLTAPWEQKQSSLKSPGSLVLFIFFCKLMSYRSFWGHESNLCLVMAERGGKTNRTSLCARTDNKMNTALPAHPCPIQTPDRASLLSCTWVTSPVLSAAPCPCQAVRWWRSLWCLLPAPRFGGAVGPRAPCPHAGGTPFCRVLKHMCVGSAFMNRECLPSWGPECVGARECGKSPGKDNGQCLVGRPVVLEVQLLLKQS